MAKTPLTEDILSQATIRSEVLLHKVTIRFLDSAWDGDTWEKLNSHAEKYLIKYWRIRELHKHFAQLSGMPSLREPLS